MYLKSSRDNFYTIKHTIINIYNITTNLQINLIRNQPLTRASQISDVARARRRPANSNIAYD